TGDLPSAELVLFQQTVPRHLVHRAAVSEVFVTDLCITGETTFQVGAQWPRAHSFFGPKARLHDPMLLAETIRQATLAIAHQVFGVPRNANFVLQEMSFTIEETGLRLDGRPADVVLIGAAHDIKRRGDVLAGLRLEYGVYRDMERVGSGRIGFRVISAASYERLRGERFGRTDVPVAMLPGVPAGPVGRTVDSDVVLAATALEDVWLLRVDQHHPVMFDHPNDHVPGMVAMEAARQAALALLGCAEAVPVTGTFGFVRYIELDEPCTVFATHRAGAGRPAVDVVLEQSGRTVATATLELLLRG
ncbi:MAG TPA: ScbA/BarX family gamma-butyrolactone biosynthesis protein, partial [Micromonosporaceae bacterium]|nr:ScbA/BarX family gamma-butyrolactone biosynthesis protein [Micromonosporaceae bacterium]